VIFYFYCLSQLKDAGDSVYERERAREMERARLKKERKDFRKQQELVYVLMICLSAAV